MENRINKNKRFLIEETEVENNNNNNIIKLNNNLEFQDEQRSIYSSKRSKLTNEHLTTDTETNRNFYCEFCNKMFATLSSLNQHIASFHMKNPSWTCSKCKKQFTNKSNLKVHLRVHTKIKPYHCKNCKYSCMHHSSIKDHIAKNHPGVIHSSLIPAYVFNSNVVPDPDQFNSESFDRDAFIAEAQALNNKLSAQMSDLIESKKMSNDFNLNSVDLSPISANSANYSDEASFSYEQSFSSVEDHYDSDVKKQQDTKQKYTSFSIDSIINDNSKNLQVKCTNFPAMFQMSSTLQFPYNFYPFVTTQFDFGCVLSQVYQNHSDKLQNFYNHFNKLQSSQQNKLV